MYVHILRDNTSYILCPKIQIREKNSLHIGQSSDPKLLFSKTGLIMSHG